MPIITIDNEKMWMPSMSPKGQQIFHQHKRVLLLHGPRKTGKSNIAQNLLIQHCFKWDRACAAIIVMGLKSAVGSGCWTDITGDRGLLQREWFTANIGCGWHQPKGEPSMMSDTKMRTCKIVNQHGGYSEIQLHTLQDESSLDKFKDSRFTYLYFVEADRWESEEVLNKLMMQLRSSEELIPHAAREVVLDCNPPRSGQDHWIYKHFIQNEQGEYPPNLDPELQEVEFVMADNPFISDAEKQEIYRLHEHDQVELERNYYGIWVKSRKGTVFKSQYQASRHIIGNVESNDEKDWTVLLPPRGVFYFPTGWDLGDSMNHAACISCKVTDASGRACIMYIDELIHLNANYAIADFGREMMDKMDYWARVMQNRGVHEIQWAFWSDPSSMRFISAAAGTAADLLTIESNGAIQLRGVRKGHGSVRVRAEFMKRALYTGQVLISAKCVGIRKMLEELVEDKNGEIDKKSPHKHIFDATTYLLTNELPIRQLDTISEERMVTL